LTDFTPTGRDRLAGWTSTDYPGIPAVAIAGNIQYTDFFGEYMVQGNGGYDKTFNISGNGAWFYREPTPAPVPPTALLLAPLAGLLIARRRRRG